MSCSIGFQSRPYSTKIPGSIAIEAKIPSGKLYLFIIGVTPENAEGYKNRGRSFTEWLAFGFINGKSLFSVQEAIKAIGGEMHCACDDIFNRRVENLEEIMGEPISEITYIG